MLAMLLGLVEPPPMPEVLALTHALSDIEPPQPPRLPRPRPRPPAPKPVRGVKLEPAPKPERAPRSPMPPFVGPYRPKKRSNGLQPRVLTEEQRERKRQKQREQRQRRKETFVGPMRPGYDNKKYMAEWRKRRSPEQIERDRASARRWKERTNYHGRKSAEPVAQPA